MSGIGLIVYKTSSSHARLTVASFGERLLKVAILLPIRLELR